MSPRDTATPEPGGRPKTTPSSALVVAAAALFTDMLVYGMAVPVLPLLPAVAERGPAATGVLFASYAAALIVATPLAGRAVDRGGPKAPLLIGLAGLAVATGLFATGGPYWVLFAARFAQGFAAGMSWVAALSLIAATTSLDRRGQAMGLAMSFVTFGVLAGPPVGGLLVERFGPQAPFLLAAALALADCALPVVLVKGSSGAANAVAGPIAVLKVPGSFSLVLAVAAGAGMLSGVEPVLPVHLGVRELVIGLVFALCAVAQMIANPLVGRQMGRISPRWLTGAGVALAATALLVVGWAGPLWQTCVGMVLLGGAIALVLAPATTLISEQGFRADPPAVGGSYALYNLAYAGGLTLGPALAGLAVERASFGAAMTLGAVLFAAIGAAALIGFPVPARD